MKTTFAHGKNLIALTLAVMMVLALAACGDKPAPGPESTSGSLISSSMPLDSTSGSDSTSPSSSESVDPNQKKPADIQKEMLSRMVAFYQKNEDTVGWITIPNTSIDDVVVQTVDNDYYLRRNKNKQQQFSGSYYADYRTILGARKDISKNVVVYGHSMDDNSDGENFSQLKKYLDLEYCKKNPYVYFSTPEAELTWQIFAVFYTDISFDYINPNPDPAAFMNIINEAKKRSQFIFDVDVTAADHILTLSTCTYTNPTNRSNYRYVVMAKLLPAGAPQPNTVKVEVNPSPKAPLNK